MNHFDFTIQDVNALIRRTNEQARITKLYFGECEAWYALNRALRELYDLRDRFVAEQRAA